MPVIPSFSGFAPAPDLAGAYLSGQRLELDRARLAQEASEAAMRAQIARQQIEAQKVNNELEWNARREIAAQTALKEDQNREVERAYNQQRLALTERQIKAQEEQATMKLKEAQRDLETRQAFLALRQRLIDQGVPEEEAAQQAFRAVGFGVPGYAGFLEPNSTRERTYNMVVGTPILGPETRLPMTAPEAEKFMQTAPPNLRTNTANQAIMGIIPRTATGTNAPVLKYNPDKGDFE